MNPPSDLFAMPVAATLPGDLLSSTAPEAAELLQRAIAEIERQGDAPRTLRVDLTAARMIDSVGLNLLVSVIKRVQGLDGSVVLVVAHTSVERILAFTRVQSIATIERVS